MKRTIIPKEPMIEALQRYLNDYDGTGKPHQLGVCHVFSRYYRVAVSYMNLIGIWVDPHAIIDAVVRDGYLTPCAHGPNPFRIEFAKSLLSLLNNPGIRIELIRGSGDIVSHCEIRASSKHPGAKNERERLIRYVKRCQKVFAID